MSPHSPWRASRATRVREHSRSNAPRVREHLREVAPDPRERHAVPTQRAEWELQLDAYARDYLNAYEEALEDGYTPDEAEEYARDAVEQEFLGDGSRGLTIYVNTDAVEAFAKNRYGADMQRLERNAFIKFEAETAKELGYHEGDDGIYKVLTGPDGRSDLYLWPNGVSDVTDTAQAKWLGSYSDAELAWKSGVNHDWTSLKDTERYEARAAQVRQAGAEARQDVAMQNDERIRRLNDFSKRAEYDRRVKHYISLGHAPSEAHDLAERDV
jgi:hypothetical protein